MKQGQGNKYILSLLTSSNSDLHKGWFYLKNDPEHALPKFTGNSISQAPRSWTDRPPKAEQERMLKEHWAALTRLREAGVDLAIVIGQYHAQGGRPALEATSSPLQDDNQKGLLDRDGGDRAHATVTRRDPASLVGGHPEDDIHVATVAASSDTPPTRGMKIS
jgi:hypothetical protein